MCSSFSCKCTRDCVTIRPGRRQRREQSGGEPAGESSLRAGGREERERERGREGGREGGKEGGRGREGGREREQSEGIESCTTQGEQAEASSRLACRGAGPAVHLEEPAARRMRRDRVELPDPCGTYSCHSTALLGHKLEAPKDLPSPSGSCRCRCKRTMACSSCLHTP